MMGVEMVLEDKLKRVGQYLLQKRARFHEFGVLLGFLWTAKLALETEFRSLGEVVEAG